MPLEIKEYENAPIKNTLTDEKYLLDQKSKNFNKERKSKKIENDKAALQQNFNKAET